MANNAFQLMMNSAKKVEKLEREEKKAKLREKETKLGKENKKRKRGRPRKIKADDSQIVYKKNKRLRKFFKAKETSSNGDNSKKAKKTI